MEGQMISELPLAIARSFSGKTLKARTEP